MTWVPTGDRAVFSAGANLSQWMDRTPGAQPGLRASRGTQPPLLTDGVEPRAGAIHPQGVPTPGPWTEPGQAAQAVTPEPGTTRPPDHPPSCPQAQQTWPRGRQRCQPLSHGGAGPHLCRPLGPAENHSPSPPDTWSDQGPGRCPGSHVHDTEASSGRTKGGRALHTRAPTLGSASTDPLCVPAFCLPGGGWGGGRWNKGLSHRLPSPLEGAGRGGALPRGPLPLCTLDASLPHALIQMKEFGGTRKKYGFYFQNWNQL